MSLFVFFNTIIKHNFSFRKIKKCKAIILNFYLFFSSSSSSYKLFLYLFSVSWLNNKLILVVVLNIKKEFKKQNKILFLSIFFFIFLVFIYALSLKLTPRYVKLMEFCVFVSFTLLFVGCFSSFVISFFFFFLFQR